MLFLTFFPLLAFGSLCFSHFDSKKSIGKPIASLKSKSTQGAPNSAVAVTYHFSCVHQSSNSCRSVRLRGDDKQFMHRLHNLQYFICFEVKILDQRPKIVQKREVNWLVSQFAMRPLIDRIRQHK